MPKSRHKRKKLSGYYIQPMHRANTAHQTVLLDALKHIGDKTKAGNPTAKAKKLIAQYHSSIEIEKKLRKTGYVIHKTI